MTTTSSGSTDKRYDKTIEVWFLLHQIEQLIINDRDYLHIYNNISNSMDVVETLQHRIEASGQ
jgi:hypothetical protein